MTRKTTSKNTAPAPAAQENTPAASPVPSEVVVFAKRFGNEPWQLMDWALTRFTVVLILDNGRKVTCLRADLEG